MARELTRRLAARRTGPAAAAGAGGGHPGRRRLVRACRARPVRRSGRGGAPGPGLRRPRPPARWTRCGAKLAPDRRSRDALAPAAPRTGGEVPLPALGDSIRLVGSDLVHWEGGTGMVALFRTAGGEPVSLFAGEAARLRRALAAQSPLVQGRTTVFWQTGPLRLRAQRRRGGVRAARARPPGRPPAVGVVHPSVTNRGSTPWLSHSLDLIRPPAGRARPSSTRACASTCCRSTTT